MKKKLLGISITLFLTIFLVACGQGQQEESTGKGGPQPASESETNGEKEVSEEHETTWPERGLTIVISFAPGGSVDRTFRPIAQHLENELGVPVKVENRPGSETRTALTYVKGHEESKEGYMFLATATPAVINGMAEIYSDKNTILPIVQTANLPNGLAVHPDSGIETFDEFVESVTEDTRMAVVDGPALTDAERLRDASGLSYRLVPYSGGGPLLTAALGNQDHAYVTSVATFLPSFDSEELTPIATFADERHPAVPDTPSIMELAEKHGWDLPSPLPPLVFLAANNEWVESNTAAAEKFEAVMLKLFEEGSPIYDDLDERDSRFAVVKGSQETKESLDSIYEELTK